MKPEGEPIRTVCAYCRGPINGFAKEGTVRAIPRYSNTPVRLARMVRGQWLHTGYDLAPDCATLAEKRPDFLKDAKVGTLVVMSMSNDHLRLASITKMGPKTFVVDQTSYNCFGRRVSGMGLRDFVVRIATAEDLKINERQNAKAQEENRRRQVKENKEKELSQLFGKEGWTTAHETHSSSEKQRDDLFCVHLNGLTESEVRKLAEFAKGGGLCR